MRCPPIYHRSLWLAPLLFVVVASALVGCTTSPPTTRGSAPTATAALPPTALPDTTPRGVRPTPVAGLLDPAPADCAVTAPPHTFTSTSFGGGFSGQTTFDGGAPAWELGLGSGPLHLNEGVGAQPYPSTKVMWVVGPNYAKPVTLTGHDIRNGTALWFQVYPSNSVPTSDPDADSIYTTQAVLDPGAPNRGSTGNSTGYWNIWGIGIMVLKAGCYELDVSSQQGSWHTVFAAGR
jgi:hypothetical protein